jgi:hypothetical protein
MGTRGPIPLLKINVVTVVSVNQILRDGPMPILDHDVDQCVNQSSSVWSSMLQTYSDLHRDGLVYIVWDKEVISDMTREIRDRVYVFCKDLDTSLHLYCLFERIKGEVHHFLFIKNP